MNTTLAKAEATADTTVAEELPDKPDPLEKLADMHAQTIGAIGKLAEAVAKPKTVKRGPDGKVTGVE